MVHAARLIDITPGIKIAYLNAISAICQAREAEGTVTSDGVLTAFQIGLHEHMTRVFVNSDHCDTWKERAAEDSYSTTEYESTVVQSESGDALAWRDDSIMCYAYEDMRGHEDYIVPASLADMFYEWSDLVSVMRGDYCGVAHAWFFPYGLYGRGEDSGMFMYATNRPNL